MVKVEVLKRKNIQLPEDKNLLPSDDTISSGKG